MTDVSQPAPRQIPPDLVHILDQLAAIREYQLAFTAPFREELERMHVALQATAARLHELEEREDVLDRISGFVGNRNHAMFLSAIEIAKTLLRNSYWDIDELVHAQDLVQELSHGVDYQHENALETARE